MAENGWEFGLHSSINTKDNLNGFRNSKDWLEELLQKPVTGIRHHYLLLDWHKPYMTLEQHSFAGFKYDTTIGYRDESGFRAGTAFPYVPYHLENDAEIDLLELPMNLMDGHVLSPHNGETGVSYPGAVREGIHMLNIVKESRGVLTPVWHQETNINTYSYNQHMVVLEKIVDAIIKEDDAWTPANNTLCNFWAERRRRLAKF